MRFFLVIVTSFIFSGCVGLNVTGYGHNEHKRDDFRISSEATILQKTGSETYTPETLVKSWGEPTEIFTYGSCTVYSYRDGVSWSGVELNLVVIPIPLYVPTGQDEVNIFFKANKSTFAITKRFIKKWEFGYVCPKNDNRCQIKAGTKNSEENDLSICVQ